MNGKILCPQCYTWVPLDGAGRIAAHSYMPMLAGAACSAVGRTEADAKADAVESIRKWKREQAAKKAE